MTRKTFFRLPSPHQAIKNKRIFEVNSQELEAARRMSQNKTILPTQEEIKGLLKIIQEENNSH